MKRYYTDNIVFGPVTDDEEVHFVVRWSDLHAWALRHKATIEGMRHGLVTGHRQPCVCVDCIQHEAIDIALREIEEIIR